MSIDTSQPILVTGASGYIASWIIKKLLEQGYTVRGSVRNLNKKDRYEHLEAMAAASPGVFQPVEADLLDAGSFDEAAKGCSIVMHTASPFINGKIKDPYESLINPALQGTINVLESVNKADSVKKVVLTSSVVAIYGDAADAQEVADQTFNESHWNTTSTADHQPYPYSKTVAERQAWEMAEKQDRWKLAVINPSFVLGPSLTQRVDSTSISTMRDLLTGKLATGVPALHFGMVDVRNIADAHLEAGFRPEAGGRHILRSEHGNLLDIAHIIEQTYPGRYNLPKRELPKWMAYLVGPFFGLPRKYLKRNVGYTYWLDNTRSRQQLGIDYIPFAKTVRDHVEQLEKDNLLQKA